MYRAVVHAFWDEVDQIWRAKIAAMPTVASRGVSVVSPPAGGGASEAAGSRQLLHVERRYTSRAGKTRCGRIRPRRGGVMCENAKGEAWT